MRKYKLIIEVEKLKAQNEILKTAYNHAMDIVQQSHIDSATITRAFRRRMGVRVANASGPKATPLTEEQIASMNLSSE